jgi:excisionase family DNA binding protein
MSKFINITDLVSRKLKKQDFITVKECAEKNNLSSPMVYWLIRQNRIQGVMRVGNQYCIPESWKYKPSRKGDLHRPEPQKIMLKNPDPFQKYVK